MVLLYAIHRHGLFTQKVREAKSYYEKVKALEEYALHMDEVENDMIKANKLLEVAHVGKTMD